MIVWYADTTTPLGVYIGMYITRNDITSRMSSLSLPDFVSDDRRATGETPGLMDLVIAAACNEVDAFLSSIYNTPFTTFIPSKAIEAATIFACEMLYQRRLVPDEKNPFSALANQWRETLRNIGSGTVPLDANIPRAFTPGFAITTDNLVDAYTF